MIQGRTAVYRLDELPSAVRKAVQRIPKGMFRNVIIVGRLRAWGYTREGQPYLLRPSMAEKLSHYEWSRTGNGDIVTWDARMPNGAPLPLSVLIHDEDRLRQKRRGEGRG